MNNTKALAIVVNGKINTINSLSISSSSGISLKYVKDNPTRVDGNPARTISYTSSFEGIPMQYETTTYMIKANKLYTIDYFSDQLKVPETLSVAQKMINSFHITVPKLADLPQLDELSPLLP